MADWLQLLQNLSSYITNGSGITLNFAILCAMLCILSLLSIPVTEWLNRRGIIQLGQSAGDATDAGTGSTDAYLEALSAHVGEDSRG